ncbi:nicotinate (nicotinamide) nucleotide adenylyltransferase [soil metagenome]
MTEHRKAGTKRSAKRAAGVSNTVRKQGRPAQRIGIFSGTFDPVHKGHISFALQAIEAAGLDKVMFVPEPRPRHKHSVTHQSHRIAMIKLAIKAYPKLGLLELPDKQFNVATSLPRLIQKYPHAQLLMLIGTDVLSHISVWPHTKQLLKKVGLVIAVRGEKDERQAFQLLANLPVEPPESHVLVSNFKLVAARDIRDAIKAGDKPEGMLATVNRYAKDHWIYVSVSGSANKS